MLDQSRARHRACFEIATALEYANLRAHAPFQPGKAALATLPRSAAPDRLGQKPSLKSGAPTASVNPLTVAIGLWDPIRCTFWRRSRHARRGGAFQIQILEAQVRCRRTANSTDRCMKRSRSLLKTSCSNSLGSGHDRCESNLTRHSRHPTCLPRLACGEAQVLAHAEVRKNRIEARNVCHMAVTAGPTHRQAVTRLEPAGAGLHACCGSAGSIWRTRIGVALRQ